jgi:hypothetical protein
MWKGGVQAFESLQLWPPLLAPPRKREKQEDRRSIIVLTVNRIQYDFDSTMLINPRTTQVARVSSAASHKTSNPLYATDPYFLLGASCLIVDVKFKDRLTY